MTYEFKKDFENIRSLLSSDILYWPESGVKSEIFSARFPESNKITKMADFAIKGRIQFWHPWHMELTHSPETIVPPKEWLVARNGDQEWLDSLVRFTHMLDLAAAHRLTGSRKYLDAFSRYIHSFSATRKTRHRHWKDLLNTAIRATNLIKALDLFRPTEIDEELLACMLKEIQTDCRFLYSGLGQKSGNWEVAISTTLLIASVYLDGDPQATIWREKALTRLKHILKTDIDQDGIQVEEVPLYHGEVILFILDYLTILHTNNIEPDLEIVETTKRMLQALDAIADPEGMIPPIGDSDRFPIKYIISIAEILIADYVPHIYQKSNSLDSQAAMTILKDVGWVVVNWGENRTGKNYLLFDCSGKPFPGMAWHSHADDLNFIYHTSEGPLVTDPGRFTYAKEFPVYLPHTNIRLGDKWWEKGLKYIFRPHSEDLNSCNWRDYFQSTLSHNTVSCNGENQPGYDELHEPGRDTKLTRAELEENLLILEGELDTKYYGKFRGCSDSISSQEHSYLHKRGIYGILPGIIIVIDRLRSGPIRDWVNSIHFSPAAKIDAVGEALHVSLGKANFLIRLDCNMPDKYQSDLVNDWASECYNLKMRSKTYRLRTKNCTNSIFITTIVDGNLYKSAKADTEITTSYDPIMSIVKVKLSLDDKIKNMEILFNDEQGDQCSAGSTVVSITEQPLDIPFVAA